MTELPNNVDAETSVLGSLLINPDSVDLIGTILKPDDFYRETNGWIYEAIMDLHKRGDPVDFISVCDELGRRNRLERVGVNGTRGAAYITQLISDTPTSIYVEHYAKIVELAATRRRIINVAGLLAQMAHNDESTDSRELMSKAESLVLKAGQGVRPKIVTAQEVLSGFWDGIFNPGNGKAPARVFTGLPGIDGPALGIESGRFWTSAAVPGTGKTAVTINIVRGIARAQGDKAAVLYFHPEQGEEEITSLLWSSGTELVPPIRVKALMMTEEERREYIRAAGFATSSTVTSVSGVDMKAAQRKVEYLKNSPQEKEIEALEHSQAEINDTPIILQDPSGWNIHQISSFVRMIRAKVPLGVFLFVVFDGAHLITGTGEGNRTQELTTITREFKIAAQKYVQPGAIWANTQLNRGIYRSEKRIYQMEHLRDSGSWEMDADVIVFWDRPSVFSEDTHAPTWDDFKGIWRKNRQTAQQYTAYFQMNTTTMKVRAREIV